MRLKRLVIAESLHVQVLITAYWTVERPEWEWAIPLLSMVISIHKSTLVINCRIWICYLGNIYKDTTMYDLRVIVAVVVIHQLDIWTCTAQKNSLESFITTFRWYCDHLHQARKVIQLFTFIRQEKDTTINATCYLAGNILKEAPRHPLRVRLHPTIQCVGYSLKLNWAVII